MDPLYHLRERGGASTPVTAVHTAPTASTASSPVDVKPKPMEPGPTTIPVPELMPEPKIIPEPEPSKNSDQLLEPATLSLPVGVLVEYMRIEWSPVPSTKVD